MQNHESPAARRGQGAAEGRPAAPAEAEGPPALPPAEETPEFQAWLDGLPEAVAVLGPRGEPQSCNAALRRLLGVPPGADHGALAAHAGWRAVVRGLPRPPGPPRDAVTLPDGRRLGRIVGVVGPGLLLLVWELPPEA